jgi:hypothetical protein
MLTYAEREREEAERAVREYEAEIRKVLKRALKEP